MLLDTREQDTTLLLHNYVTGFGIDTHSGKAQIQP